MSLALALARSGRIHIHGHERLLQLSRVLLVLRDCEASALVFVPSVNGRLRSIWARGGLERIARVKWSARAARIFLMIVQAERKFECGGSIRSIQIGRDRWPTERAI